MALHSCCSGRRVAFNLAGLERQHGITRAGNELKEHAGGFTRALVTFCTGALPCAGGQGGFQCAEQMHKRKQKQNERRRTVIRVNALPACLRGAAGALG